jgi:Arc/MetJ-type ribon-helix-helix transcriptional regulator
LIARDRYRSQGEAIEAALALLRGHEPEQKELPIPDSFDARLRRLEEMLERIATPSSEEPKEIDEAKLDAVPGLLAPYVDMIAARPKKQTFTALAKIINEDAGRDITTPNQVKMVYLDLTA